jgi:hypothetical protein
MIYQTITININLIKHYTLKIHTSCDMNKIST